MGTTASCRPPLFGMRPSNTGSAVSPPCIEFSSEAAVSAFEVFGPPGFFVLPELLVGLFDLREDLSCSFGLGYQVGLNKSTIDTKYGNALIVKWSLLF
ncbi:protein of unknown function [Methylacidimicrobium sp. AP8]|nr:protein of unknown function [Methylacidimicrobium sp. AP8]